MSVVNPVVIFPWNGNFDTGIVLIDEQHKRLVNLLNNLAGHVAFDSNLQTLNEVFSELSDYAVYHFTTEEKIWERYLPNDELTLTHHRTHGDFTVEVNRLMAEKSALPLEAALEDMVSFLTHWLAFHILESDQRMSKIVLAIQDGLSVEAAKVHANEQMSGAMRVLIETVLKMYDSLSTRTFQLLKEIAERQRAEQKLRLAGNVINSTLEAIFITDAKGTIVDVNPAFCEQAGSACDQLVGQSIRDVSTGLKRLNLSESIWIAASESGHWAGEIWSIAPSGEGEATWLAFSAVKDEAGSITNFVGVFSSASQLLQRQYALEDAANHDMLTGLPNRRLLKDRLDQAMVRTRRSGNKLAVCYLDLDGFKQVNDMLGHAAGDVLLKVIALRLAKTIRGDDTVARLGGDEFVVLLNNIDQIGDCDVLLQRLMSDIEMPVVIEDTVAQVSGSIGVTIFPEDDATADELLQHADEAMYQSKRKGKNSYTYHATTFTSAPLL